MIFELTGNSTKNLERDIDISSRAKFRERINIRKTIAECSGALESGISVMESF